MLQATDHYAQLFAVRLYKDTVDLSAPNDWNAVEPIISAHMVPRETAKDRLTTSQLNLTEAWLAYFEALAVADQEDFIRDDLNTLLDETITRELLRAAFPTKTRHCVRLYVVYEVDKKIRTAEVFVAQPAFLYREEGIVKSKEDWYSHAKQLAALQIWPHFRDFRFDEISVKGVLPIGSNAVKWFEQTGEDTYRLMGDSK